MLEMLEKYAVRICLLSYFVVGHVAFLYLATNFVGNYNQIASVNTNNINEIVKAVKIIGPKLDASIASNTSQDKQIAELRGFMEGSKNGD